MCDKELIKQLLNTIDTLNNTITEQANTIRELNETIKELKEKLNKNSKNSSKPPSSDGFKKTNLKVYVNPQVKKLVLKKVIRAVIYQ